MSSFSTFAECQSPEARPQELIRNPLLSNTVAVHKALGAALASESATPGGPEEEAAIEAAIKSLIISGSRHSPPCIRLSSVARLSPPVRRGVIQAFEAELVSYRRMQASWDAELVRHLASIGYSIEDAHLEEGSSSGSDRAADKQRDEKREAFRKTAPADAVALMKEIEVLMDEHALRLQEYKFLQRKMRDLAAGKAAAASSQARRAPRQPKSPSSALEGSSVETVAADAPRGSMTLPLGKRRQEVVPPQTPPRQPRDYDASSKSRNAASASRRGSETTRGSARRGFISTVASYFGSSRSRTPPKAEDGAPQPPAAYDSESPVAARVPAVVPPGRARNEEDRYSRRIGTGTPPATARPAALRSDQSW